VPELLLQHSARQKRLFQPAGPFLRHLYSDNPTSYQTCCNPTVPLRTTSLSNLGFWVSSTYFGHLYNLFAPQ
jgi:hypothetical protein